MQWHSAYLVCWTTYGWTDTTVSQQLATTLTDGNDNFWLTKRLIQDSTKTSLYSTSCCHHCQQNWEAGRPTASLNHCFMIASFQDQLGRRLGGHQHHGQALVAISVSNRHEQKALRHSSNSALTAEMFQGWFSGLSIQKPQDSSLHAASCRSTCDGHNIPRTDPVQNSRAKRGRVSSPIRLLWDQWWPSAVGSGNDLVA